VTQTMPAAPVTTDRLRGWSDDCWDAALERYVSWRANHGRQPRRHRSGAEERGIAGWLNRQQTAHRSGTLHPDRVDALDRAAPGWNRGRFEASQQRLVELRDFVNETGRWPRRHADSPAECDLGHWVADRLKGRPTNNAEINQGVLDIAREHGLPQHPPRLSREDLTFPVRRANYLARAATYAAFTEDHLHAPRSIDGDPQRPLYDWGRRVRRHLAAGSIDADEMQGLRDAGLVDRDGAWIEPDPVHGCPAGRCLR
jgi:hypothetical protein